MAPPNATATTPHPEATLAQRSVDYRNDPLGWVKYAFPWSDPADELAASAGPYTWQSEILTEIGHLLRGGEPVAPILQAISSGHGIGKSSVVSWLVLWAMSTMPDCRCVVTANTESQLRTKTWAELNKWHRLSIYKHWFTWSATKFAVNEDGHEGTWRADAIPWSETRTEAFAGLHNQGRRILVVFDEASAVPDVIWDVTEGALTDSDTQIIWCAFGNPTRNTGRFRECFGRLAHRWHTRQIDSRTVEGTAKAQMQAWVDDYGEDSDFVRVRVRGVFPRAGSMQFIGADVIAEAVTREATSTIHDPLIMGVDVARFGADASVIRFRRGRDARQIPTLKMRGVDTMTLAGRVASLIAEHLPDAVFIDETGVGGGVVDRVRQLGHQVIGVNFGAKADGDVDGEHVANKRAEMWAQMRSWLASGGAIENDPELRADLESVEYGYDAQNRIILEKKDDMRKRGLASPDQADALCLTFAHPVAKVTGPSWAGRHHAAKSEYDPFN